MIDETPCLQVALKETSSRWWIMQHGAGKHGTFTPNKERQPAVKMHRAKKCKEFLTTIVHGANFVRQGRTFSCRNKIL